MRTAVVNASGAEIMEGSFTNVEGATVTTGFPVCYTTTAASVDGNAAVLPAAANFITFAGIALSDVADTDTGVMCMSGYCASVRIFATGTSVTNAAGIALGTNASSLGVNSTGLLDSYGPVVSLQSIGAAINSPGGWAKGLVRLL